MSENIVNVPAHIAARIAARTGQQKNAVMSAIVSGDGFQYPKISTKGSRFRLVEDGVETVVGTEMSVVIVGANPKVSKIFYARVFDPNDVSPPDCFSDDGIVPDSSVSEPVHTSCITCPNNILGSKVNPGGAKSKICSDQRHLAVVAAADPEKVYGLSVPVSGMKALREYFKSLSNYGLIPQEVVTELSFDDEASYPKLLFSRKGFVPEKGLPIIEKIEASPDVLAATRQIDPSHQLAAPKPIVTTDKVVAKPKPVESEEEDTTPTVAVVKPVAKAKTATAPTPVVEAVAEVTEESPSKTQLDSLEKKLGSIFGDDD